MSVFETNSRIFEESFFFCFYLKKTVAEVTVRLRLVKELVVSDFNASRAMILMLRTGMVVEKRKFWKIPNWRHYLLNIRTKAKKIWQNHWE